MTGPSKERKFSFVWNRAVTKTWEEIALAMIDGQDLMDGKEAEIVRHKITPLNGDLGDPFSGFYKVEGVVRVKE